MNMHQNIPGHTPSRRWSGITPPPELIKRQHPSDEKRWPHGAGIIFALAISLAIWAIVFLVVWYG